jgi:uncharacterized membrane protein YgaE (UPF0421/DUF939 family)
MLKKTEMIEIWGDVVEIKSLVIAILISATSTMGAFFLATTDDQIEQLFFGLIGAVIGFTISTLLIKPKRIIHVGDSTEVNHEGVKI